MNTKVVAIAVVAILAVAGVGVILMNPGNGPSGPQFGEDGKVLAQKCEPYTITDAAGQEFTFDHTFGPGAFTACTYGGAFFTLAALTGQNLPKYIAGMDLAYSKGTTFGYFFDEMPELNEVTDIYSGGTNKNAVISSGAEIVIDLIANKVKNETSGGLKEATDEQDIPILYLNYQSEDPQIIADGIKMIGKLWGLDQKAEQLADFYVSKTAYIFDNAEKLIAANGGERPLIVAEYAGSVSTVKTSWSKNVQWGALIWRIGGSNFVNEGPDYPQLALADIIGAQPNKMMYSSNIAYGDDTIHIGYGFTEERTVQDVKALFDGREDFSDLPAWNADPKQVYVVNHMMNRNIFGFASVEFIAKMIWTEEYKDLTPAEDLKAFWDEWLPFSYQGVWMLDVGEYLANHS